MLSHPSFVVHAVITLQGIESPRQPPRQRHYSDPLATAGCKAFCPLPQLAPYHPLAAPYPPSCSAQQRPHLLTALLGDLATLLSRLPCQGDQPLHLISPPPQGYRASSTSPALRGN
jgi:hypothetical protein